MISVSASGAVFFPRRRSRLVFARDTSGNYSRSSWSRTGASAMTARKRSSGGAFAITCTVGRGPLPPEAGLSTAYRHTRDRSDRF